MLKKLSLCLLALSTTVLSFSQGLGTLQGKIKDKTTGEMLPFVNVVVELNGTQKGGASSDFDGNYKISSINPGTYTVRASSIGYKQRQIDGVVLKSNQIVFLEIEMESGDVQLDAVVVTSYAIPLIDKDGGASGGTVTRDDIAKMPGRSATSIAQTVGGVYSQEGSGALSIRGARSDASYYFIDGIKVRGSSGLPKSAIEEVSVITGGLPANYGDATGGVISITTRGPSSQFFGGIDMLTSGFKNGNDKTFGLDKYAFNLIEGSISGPLIMKKDSTGKKVKPILGFFISGNYTNSVDNRPFFTQSLKVKEDVRQNLLENPLRPTGTGFGVNYNTDFLRLTDFDKVAYRHNAGSQSATAAGKIDVNTGPSINLTFGGSFDWSKYSAYDFGNSLFNSENNGEIKDLTWRVYGRFTQRFLSTKSNGTEPSSSKIKNAFYTVMVDYSKYTNTSQDANHKDKLFNYGYVGQFKTLRENSYEFGDYNGFFARIHNGFRDTLVQYTPYYLYDGMGTPETEDDQVFNPNPDLSAITNQYFSLYDAENNYENLTQIQAANALRNGDQPNSVYGLWNNIGTQYNAYSLTDNTQFRITASGSADIGNHALTVGFEYEQRTDRSFNVSPVGLWTIARQYMNFHIRELDVNNPMISYFGTFAQVDYNRLVSDGQYKFDESMRTELGASATEFIDIDALDPNMFRLDMFSADELLNNGSNYVDYYGYTYDGKKNGNKATFDDFFTKKDAGGYFAREIPAFEPIYIAGYIMDKFTFDDLIFNVGLRIDRFDANQPVLKDKYLLYSAQTVAEVRDDASDPLYNSAFPTNMGDDYIVYVNDINDPTAINGFRNGSVWYNASGEEISDPRTIYSAAGVAPYLTEGVSPDDEISSSAFQDYKPQINVMPRVAFSFPISEDALFFAHYDVLTKRPTSGNRFDMLDYFFMQNRSVIVNNPDLKPEKTIDYELGFQQVLTKSSSIKVSAFYRELRDMVALVNVTGAYPRTYRSWGNIDFGTIKGITLTYDLRRTGNLWMRASYTLQFAEGTGSDAGSALNLVNSGQPNLRTIYPFNYDQRHGFNTTIDYRYGEGKDYNGPKLFGKNILENTGINIVNIFGSGTPYSAQQFVTPQALGGTSSLEGQVNGSRKPGQFRMDAQIDKNITLKFGKKGEEGDDKEKTANLNIYLQVNNVLNTKNILGVYGATGTPDDDGYLAEARYDQIIAQQVSEISFREYYALAINNPYNYGLPRTIRIGVKLDF
jgi:hypothetical protein